MKLVLHFAAFLNKLFLILERRGFDARQLRNLLTCSSLFTGPDRNVESVKK
jgi:hypothetical protein